MTRRSLLTVFAAVVAFVAGLQFARWLTLAPPPAGPAIELRDQVFIDLDSGAPRTLAELSGRTLLVNFWATWCPPCKKEMPLFQLAQTQYAAEGLQIVAIAIDDADAVRRFRDELDLRFPIWIDQRGAARDLMLRYGNRTGGLPFSLLLDRAGDVVANKLGAYTHNELTAALQAHLPDSKSNKM